MRNDSKTNGRDAERVGEIVSIRLRGKVWRAIYQHAGKQVRKSLKTRNKKIARRKALTIERDVLAGNLPAVNRPPLISAVADDFRAAKVGEGLARKTIQKYDHCIKQLMQLADELEIKRINQITPSFMDKFRAKRVALLSLKPGRDGQKTAANDLVTIREIVNFALGRKLINDDPLDGFSIKKVKTKPQPYWNQQQLDRILAAATRQPHKDIYTLLGLTGLRVGDAQHLTWDDIDFDAEVINIQAKPGWKPKTGDARVVPIMAGVREVLERQPRCSKWVFTFPADSRGPARQVRQRRLLDYLKRLLKRLGMPGHLHTLRHSFVSLALTRGIDPATVRKWVGHVDRDTLDHYTHIANHDSHAAMRRLEASIRENRQRS